MVSKSMVSLLRSVEEWEWDKGDDAAAKWKCMSRYQSVVRVGSLQFFLCFFPSDPAYGIQHAISSSRPTSFSFRNMAFLEGTQGAHV